jgi:hypothetical protein
MGVHAQSAPPGATITFVLFGLGVILSNRFRMNLSQWRVGARAAVNIAYLLGCFGAMLLLVRLT